MWYNKRYLFEANEEEQHMNDQISEMRERALARIRESVDTDKLNEVRVAFLGK